MAGKGRDREKVNAYAKKYRLEKLDAAVLAAYYRQWRIDNKDKIKEKRSSPESRERENKRSRERYASDPEYRFRRNALGARSKWAFSAEFTYEMLLDIRSQDCFYCGNEGGTADHLVPKSKGGLDRLDNLVPCCSKCNARKGTRTLTEFYKN